MGLVWRGDILAKGCSSLTTLGCGRNPFGIGNPANAFFRARMIAAWGRDIQRMLEARRNAKVPEPGLR